MREDLEDMMIALLNSTTDSIDIMDENGYYLLVNDAKAAKRGLNYKQMVGRHISEIMEKADVEQILSDNRKIIETGESIRKDEKIHYPGGKSVWVSVSKSLYVGKNGCKGVISVSRDITARHTAEENLKKANEKMLTMLGVAKHDIRNRAIAIVGIAKRLLKRRYKDVDVAYQEVLSLGQFIEKIVNDYLQKSFFKDEEIPERNNFDLDTDIIQPILGKFNHLIDDNDIYIDNILGGIPVDEISVTNEEKTVLGVIYLNLIENALRYGGNGIRIAIGYEKTEKFLKLNVFDTGNLIPEEAREKIFNPGFTTGTDTTGEGLSRCRELARHHGGDLIYEITSDGHNNFIILWPRK